MRYRLKVGGKIEDKMFQFMFFVVTVLSVKIDLNLVTVANIVVILNGWDLLRTKLCVDKYLWTKTREHTNF